MLASQWPLHRPVVGRVSSRRLAQSSELGQSLAEQSTQRSALRGIRLTLQLLLEVLDVSLNDEVIHPAGSFDRGTAHRPTAPM